MSGLLIVIEAGSDASGKETQSILLKNRLESEGYKVRKITFPNYENKSSTLVKMYLAGDFGTSPLDVNPYTASTFYAVDRFASYKTDWKDFLEDGGIIIADRYTTSNMVHQASKYESIEEKNKFLDWLYDLEFEKMGLPKPDEVIFLNMEIEVSLKLIENRSNKITGESEKDIHEKDSDYMRKTYENSLWVAKKYNWKMIQCSKDDKPKLRETIHEDVYNELKPLIKKI
jgi:dTMP kinase